MAITTIYRGIEYRSRLEARWASFFTNLGWHHTYEPFDGYGYIPDFLVHGERPVIVEVKPAVTLGQYRAPTAKAENGLRDWDGDILIVGADPFPTWSNSGSAGDFPAAGLLGEFFPGDEHVAGPTWDWGPCSWFMCRECGHTAVLHDYLTWAGRPCGHYEGDHLLGHVSLDSLRAVWADACNDVKWRGHAA